MEAGRKAKKGFTLIELIVVLVIMAILAAAAIPTMMGYVEEAQASQHMAEARTIYVAATAAYTEAYGLYGETPIDLQLIFKKDEPSPSPSGASDAYKLIEARIYEICSAGVATSDEIGKNTAAMVKGTTDGRVISVDYFTPYQAPKQWHINITIDPSGESIATWERSK